LISVLKENNSLIVILLFVIAVETDETTDFLLAARNLEQVPGSFSSIQASTLMKKYSISHFELKEERSLITIYSSDSLPSLRTFLITIDIKEVSQIAKKI